jgi:hypothetical protein
MLVQTGQNGQEAPVALPEGMYSFGAAARDCGWHKDAIWQCVKDGRLHFERYAGRKVILNDELQRFKREVVWKVRS